MRTIASRGVLLAVFFFTKNASAQESAFRWVNPMPDGANERLTHGTYHSGLMDVDVGYVVYLPPGYDAPQNSDLRYPVVYYLHGGRLGSEARSIPLADLFDDWITSGVVSPRLYVFVNGGRLGHYDSGESQAESSFVSELIPHIDQNFRTFDNRLGRALEGFSAGGRGTARVIFKYPRLFCSAAPMSGGHQHEARISENAGRESDDIVHGPLDNSWDLARLYAERDSAPDVNLLVAVGSADMNYQGNLDWMDHLRGLAIPFDHMIAPDVRHSVVGLLQSLGPSIELFHERCFGSVAAGGA